MPLHTRAIAFGMAWPAESPVSWQERGGEPEPEVEAGQISKGKILS